MVQGYDSVRVAWGQCQEPRVGWDRVTETSGGTKSGLVRYVLNLPDVQFTRTYDPEQGRLETVAQTSLPKLLYGRNAGVVLSPAAAPEAVERLDARIHEYFPDAPEAADMVVRRVDATGDRVLRSEGDVRAVIRYLWATERRGKPGGDYGVRGQSGYSVAWPRKNGGVGWKVYSKHLEALFTGDLDGARDAEGWLRVEAGALGQRALRNLGLGEGGVTLARLLDVPDAPAKILGGLGELVDRAVKAVMSEMDYWSAFLRLKQCTPAGAKRLRTDRVMALLGYARVAQSHGWEAIGLSRQQLWQLKREFKLRELDPMTIDFSDRYPVRDVLMADAETRQRLLPFAEAEAKELGDI